MEPPPAMRMRSFSRLHPIEGDGGSAPSPMKALREDMLATLFKVILRRRRKLLLARPLQCEKKQHNSLIPQRFCNLR